MRKLDLQLFAEVVAGKQIVYLFRANKNKTTEAGTTIAFTTENERTKSSDSDSTPTKDGAITAVSDPEVEITATALLAVGDEKIDSLEDALDNHDLMDIWEANLAEPVTGQTNKFKGRYFQGYVSELDISSNADDNAEVSLTFAINGKGVKGNVTVTTEQQEAAAYVFTDTPAG